MLTRIQHRLPELSRAEQRVARWVLEHPQQAAKSKLAGVAMACRTSEPTVIRFCRHLGLAGFRDFTLRLTESLSHPAVYVHRDVSKDDTALDAVSKVMDASIRSLIDVRARAASMPFEQAVAAMLPARQLVFVGLGASGHVAKDACHKFFRLGVPCSVQTDAPSCLQSASVAHKNDVMVITSRSGESTDLVRVAELARNRGAQVVAITEHASRLAAVSSIVFSCHTQEDTNVYTPMSSRLAHLAVLDALQIALALQMGEAAVENLRRAKNAILRSPAMP